MSIGAAGVVGRGSLASPKLDIQLKCTNVPARDLPEAVSCQLSLAHHDILRAPACTPKILVVLMLPEDSDRWVEHTPENLIMRRCAYWKSFSGESAYSTTAAKPAFRVPKSQVFSPDELKRLMEKISLGETP